MRQPFIFTGIFTKEQFDWIAIEIIRLASAEPEREVLVSITDQLSSRWIYNNRYKEALALLEMVNKLIPSHYKIQFQLARCQQVLGIEAEKVEKVTNWRS
ncbi:MAG: hypothetical protein R2795_23690 [Saprospiraceae bacterium]